MRGLDFSSWQGLLSTLVGLAIITLIGVGIRLLVMQVVQQKREAANRQINERLKTLIAAYKTLGGSFTGDLSVDPIHLREIRRRAAGLAQGQATPNAEGALLLPPIDGGEAGDRARRIRDAVEAALSDVILLGTEEQVRLAARAATDMVEGRPIHTAALVVSLRDFIRGVLDLDTIPASVAIPQQGPARPTSSGGGGKGGGKDKEGAAGGAGKGGGGGMGGMGAGVGMGAGLGYGAGRGGEEEAQ
ncbi:MAG: hypothetical protein ACN6RG_08805 [Stenotrophomonas sp.]|jgi:uncharacterized membrane protein YgcG|uniref:hypothetical protein n=1 Tax=unclassified Stenotrophomonas TaxID=196198 RepID=UPI001784DAE7|nr:hypothetical protein [Stenotrophomonas sp. STM01]MBD9535913.1 hypothetical protein [Stenotrophomonas sp. STM01]